MAGPGPTVNTLKRSRRAAAVTGVMSFAFGVFLIVWGASIQSVSMTAGGILAAVRGVMGGLIIAGIRLSRRHSDDFPDGLYKLENFFAAAVGVTVLVLTYELARISIQHLHKAHMFADDPRYALPFFIAAALLAGGTGLYKRRVAKEEGCPSLKADASFSFADAGALVIIGVALALDIAGYRRVDAVAGLIVACLLAVIGIQVLLGALKVLLDASVSDDVLSLVKEIAEADPGVREVLGVGGRNSGSFVFLNLEVVPAAYDLGQAGAVSRGLERRIKAAVPNLDRVIIEFSAPADLFTVAVPVDPDGNSIETDFESAPKIGLIEIEGGAARGGPELIANPAAGISAGRGVHLAVFMGRRPVDVLLLKEEIEDEEVLLTLQAYGIDVTTMPSLDDLESALAEIPGLALARTGAEASSEGASGPTKGRV